MFLLQLLHSTQNNSYRTTRTYYLGLELLRLLELLELLERLDPERLEEEELLLLEFDLFGV